MWFIELDREKREDLIMKDNIPRKEDLFSMNIIQFVSLYVSRIA